MKKHLKILALILTIPVFFYFVGVFLFTFTGDALVSFIMPKGGFAIVDPLANVHLKGRVTYLFSGFITALYAIFIGFIIRKKILTPT